MINTDDISSYYKEFKISKGNGKFRHIKAPNEELKKEQNKIINEYLKDIKISKNAYGFINNKSIYDNALLHLESKWILEMDLKDFFDTISYDMVKKSLMIHDIDENTSEYIAKVCTYNGYTPQGAPSSPILSNIVMKPLDAKLNKLSKDNKLTYTRYADDITFSSNEDNGYEVIQSVKPKIQSIVQKNGFVINQKKTRTVGTHYRQSVTGVVVNEKMGISKKVVNRYRGLLHSMIKAIEENPNISKEDIEKSYGSFNSIQGYVNYIYNSNKEKYQKYWDQVIFIREHMKTHG